MNLQLFNFFKEDIVVSPALKQVVEKVLVGGRISEEEGLLLYQSADLGLLSFLADATNRSKNADNVLHGQSLNIDLSNVCVYTCPFCTYCQKPESSSAFSLTPKDLKQKLQGYSGVTKYNEVIISSACHPDHTLSYYTEMVSVVRKTFPNTFIRAFSATDLSYLLKKEKVSVFAGINLLKSVGVNAVSGGGAEIFSPEIREKISPEKVKTEEWLDFHESLHRSGIKSSASMLYGHIESYKHRIEHMSRLRTLQDRTNGFISFTPFKYKKENNKLSSLGEAPLVEDLRNFAIARIFLDNFQHQIAFAPMLKASNIALTLSFGVNCIEGSVNQGNKVYSQTPSDSKPYTPMVEEIILNAKKKPKERDGLYNVL